MTEKQRRFAEAYAQHPNATAVAIAAGYAPRSAYSQGQRLLKNAEVKNYLDGIREATQSEAVCTVAEVRKFWSAVVNDEAEKMPARLKASELLARSMGMFIAEAAEETSKGECNVVVYLPELDELPSEEQGEQNGITVV